MNAEYLLIAGGLFNVVFALFHLLFWKLFRWHEELAKLSGLNRAIVQVLNLCLTFVFVIFAYVSFAHAGELLGTALGRSLLLLIGTFWYLRAIEHVWLFRVRSRVSHVFLVLFLIGGSLYVIPLFL
jgi:hypothetical protein